MKKITILCSMGLLLCGSLLAASEESAAAGEAAPAEEALPAEETREETEEEWQSLSQGIRYQVVHEGDGTKASLWASVYLHYRITGENGTVLVDTYRDWNHGGRAHKHVIGSGALIEALEMVLTSMRERDRRLFLIPAELFKMYDFHQHVEGEEHDDEEHERVAAALRPGTMLRAEVSLLWVRPYDPANFNRFRVSSD